VAKILAHDATIDGQTEQSADVEQASQLGRPQPLHPVVYRQLSQGGTDKMFSSFSEAIRFELEQSVVQTPRLSQIPAVRPFRSRL